MSDTGFKDILVNLPVNEGNPAFVDFALSMADMFQAHVTGLAFAYKVAMMGVPFESFASDMIAAQEEKSENAAKNAVAQFEKAAQRANILSQARVISAQPSEAPTSFSFLARRFDLSLFSQTPPDSLGPEDIILESALFESGRPIMVVPYIQKDALKLDHVMLCWDGGPSAARAINDALPFLRRAKAIEVVTVAEEGKKSDSLPGFEIARHLARHNLKIDSRNLPAAGISVADAILSYMSDSGTSLVVMGGYGHSRLREFVLGGTTRTMLQSMTAPIFMAH